MNPSFEGVTQALDKLRLDLAGVAVDIGSMELALAEALNNCVEHGAATVDVLEISLVCTIEDNQFCILIRENSARYQLPTAFVSQANSDRSVEETLEGGFGWHLIHSLADQVALRRVKGWNELTLHFGGTESEWKDCGYV